MMQYTRRWGVEWHSENKLDGLERYFMWNGVGPHLFYTRQKARTFITERYGYIRTRSDLRRDPHGWRMPKAVRVLVRLTKGSL